MSSGAAGPEAIAEVARAAERFGFDSVSLSERPRLPAGTGDDGHRLGDQVASMAALTKALDLDTS
ncbi:hypothetical protein ACGF0K_12040 [Streptomyces sp. NPDC048156]|uniref:hypothetical protein n=1 Tax=Streptomyces sp. NPDC048156 TaxID=3365502 RepID=UPI0037139768